MNHCPRSLPHNTFDVEWFLRDNHPFSTKGLQHVYRQFYMKRSHDPIHLTKAVVNSIVPPNEGQRIYYDDSLKGFGVRITKTTKTYIAECRVAGRVRRVKIDAAHLISAEDARKEAMLLLSEMHRGIDPTQRKREQAAKSVTLIEAFDRFISSRQLRPATIKLYRHHMFRSFLDWQNKAIIHITRDMVQDRHAQLSVLDRERKNKHGTGQAYANQAMRFLRTVLNFAASVYEDAQGRSILPENPVKRLSQTKAWNKNIKRQSVIQSKDLADWYKAVCSRDETIRDYLLLCLFTGLRRNEAASLRWENVSFRHETLTIPSAVTKNKEEHRLPLSKFIFDLLKKRSKLPTVSNDFVFPGYRKNLHLVETKWSVRKIEEQSGIKFMVHDLRRTFLTIAEGLDIPHYALRKLANHKSNDVTGSYIVNDVERLRQPMEKISQEIMNQLGLSEESDSITV